MQPDWEIWLDTNISQALAKWIAEYINLSVKSSYSLNLHHKKDLDIYKLANAAGNVILISKDSDFSELISRLGSPPKLINIKFGNCSNSHFWDKIKPKIKEVINLLIEADVNIVEIQ